MRMLRHLIPATAGFALLVATVPVRGQGFMSSSSGSSSGSSFGSNMGSSGFGSTGTGSSSFLGSTGTGSGSSSFLGSSGTGTGTRTGTGSRTGTTTTTPGATTFLGPSFASPLAMGYSGLTTFPASSANPSVIRSNTFGTTMFTIPTSTITSGSSSGTSAYNSKSSYGTAVIQPAAGAAEMYASTVGIRKSPTYVTEPRFRLPPVSLGALETNVRGAIEQSSQLQSNGNNVRIMMDGPVVVLRGTVEARDDRNLAEDLVRLVPGVTAVSNELIVRTAE
jgi:hypothetical protein